MSDAPYLNPITPTNNLKHPKGHNLSGVVAHYHIMVVLAEVGETPSTSYGAVFVFNLCQWCILYQRGVFDLGYLIDPLENFIVDAIGVAVFRIPVQSRSWLEALGLEVIDVYDTISKANRCAYSSKAVVDDVAVAGS